MDDRVVTENTLLEDSFEKTIRPDSIEEYIGLVLSFIPIINNIAFFIGILALIFGIIGIVKKAGKGKTNCISPTTMLKYQICY